MEKNYGRVQALRGCVGPSSEPKATRSLCDPCVMAFRKPLELFVVVLLMNVDCSCRRARAPNAAGGAGNGLGLRSGRSRAARTLALSHFYCEKECGGSESGSRGGLGHLLTKAASRPWYADETKPPMST